MGGVVIDSSVLVAALVDSGSSGEWAETIAARGSLHAPELLPAEAANVLRRLEAAGHITTAQAQTAYEDLLQLEIELFPFEPFADRVWELRHNVTAYDAWYVALAEALRLPLATLDQRLVRAPRVTCKFSLPAQQEG